MPNQTFMNDPRVKIHRDWIDLISSLEKENPDKWLVFFRSVVGYAVGERVLPDFSDDTELMRLWEQTDCIQFNAIRQNPGHLKRRTNTRGGKSNGK